MERLVLIAKKLRTEQNFHGYIHLKTIPGASEALVHQAGLYADRLSVNVEMPTEQSLKLLAPDKRREDMLRPMRYLQGAIQQNRNEKKQLRKTPLFAPAGQSTQMVIGATPETDLVVLHLASGFYKKMQLRRVYYSGYIPISNDNRLPAIGTPVPMIRENRLYQADWLMRFYGFGVEELVSMEAPLLDIDVDPKLGWALRNMHLFPIDLNKADLHLIRRIPGIGIGSSNKIVASRAFGRLSWENLKKMGVALNRAQYFITVANAAIPQRDYLPGQIKQRILAQGNSKYRPNFSPQLSIF
jgi:putative DNA modification/repair radical SAM protein